MTIKEAFTKGMVVAHFINGNEVWAYRRRPELFPYDCSWFEKIPPKERIQNGILLDNREELKPIIDKKK